MKIYYWCPFLSHVATIRAVLNSAYSIKKYSKNSISPYIINAVGEWNTYSDFISINKIGLVNFSNSDNFYKSLPRYGYLKSRIAYGMIFFKTFKKLFKFLKSLKENDIFIIHLISSLPLFLILFFNFRCKFVLRISGYPQLNPIRKIFWKLCKKKINFIFCPTEDTKNKLSKEGIFEEKSCRVIKDPVINVKKINKFKKEEIDNILKNKRYLINIGRLTKQKNQKLLINAFSEISKLDSELNLVILGNGELKAELQNLVKEKNLESKVFFMGHVNNVYKYLYNAECFILSSKWEDPGFVIIEAAYLRNSIISSNCPNGPKEILADGKGGYLFENNKLYDFVDKIKEYLNDNEKSVFFKKKNTLSNVKNYTCFRHYINLIKILK